MLNVLRGAVSDKWENEEVAGGLEKETNKDQGTEIEQRFK